MKKLNEIIGVCVCGLGCMAFIAVWALGLIFAGWPLHTAASLPQSVEVQSGYMPEPYSSAVLITIRYDFAGMPNYELYAIDPLDGPRRQCLDNAMPQVTNTVNNLVLVEWEVTMCDEAGNRKSWHRQFYTRRVDVLDLKPQ